MQYLLLIYRSDAEYGRMNADDRKAVTAEYGAYTQSIIQSGHFKAGDGLQPVSTATTVRVRDGKTLTIDWPFAETRDLLVGLTGRRQVIWDSSITTSATAVAS